MQPLAGCGKQAWPAKNPLNSANCRLTVFDPASSVPSFPGSYVLAQGRRGGSGLLAWQRRVARGAFWPFSSQGLKSERNRIRLYLRAQRADSVLEPEGCAVSAGSSLKKGGHCSQEGFITQNKHVVY